MFSFWPRLAICASLSLSCCLVRSRLAAIEDKLGLQLVDLLVQQRDLGAGAVAQLLLIGQLRLHRLTPLLLRHRPGGGVLRLFLQLVAQSLPARGPGWTGSRGPTASPATCPCRPRRSSIQCRDLPLHFRKLALGVRQFALRGAVAPARRPLRLAGLADRSVASAAARWRRWRPGPPSWRRQAAMPAGRVRRCGRSIAGRVARPTAAGLPSCHVPATSASASADSCWFALSSAWLRPDSVTVRNACASTKTSSTKMMTISNVDSAST